MNRISNPLDTEWDRILPILQKARPGLHLAEITASQLRLLFDMSFVLAYQPCGHCKKTVGLVYLVAHQSCPVLGAYVDQSTIRDLVNGKTRGLALNLPAGATARDVLNNGYSIKVPCLIQKISFLQSGVVRWLYDQLNNDPYLKEEFAPSWCYQFRHSAAAGYSQWDHFCPGCKMLQPEADLTPRKICTLTPLSQVPIAAACALVDAAAFLAAPEYHPQNILKSGWISRDGQQIPLQSAVDGTQTH